MEISLSSADTECVQEIFYLLNFFSKSYEIQWDTVPKNFTPVWIEIGMVQCNVSTPIDFLICMLTGSIESMEVIQGKYQFNDNTIDILVNEVYSLVEYWIIPCIEFILSTETMYYDKLKIWLILSRLCKITLSYENWEKYQLNDLSFEHFLEKYAYPYDSIV
jgi:hypothetical protein